jgi:ribonuclease VapC
MVLYARKGHRAVAVLDDLLKLQRFEITPPILADMEAAYAAYLIYGKGSGHRAGLNFGDVFSYALAKVRNLPLLFKGNDFTDTDLRPAIPNLPGSGAVTS